MATQNACSPHDGSLKPLSISGSWILWFVQLATCSQVVPHESQAHDPHTFRWAETAFHLHNHHRPVWLQTWTTWQCEASTKPIDCSSGLLIWYALISWANNPLSWDGSKSEGWKSWRADGRLECVVLGDGEEREHRADTHNYPGAFCKRRAPQK